MNSIVVAGIVFGCAFGGAIVGFYLQRLLPESHTRAESREVIKLGTGLIATMAALVLGLLVGAAKSVFDSQTIGYQSLSANLLLLDQELAHCGPEARVVREKLRTLAESTLNAIWPADGSPRSGLTSSRITEDGAAFYDALQAFTPQDNVQRSAQSLALQTAAELGKTRWLLSQQVDDSLPIPLLVVLGFWMAVLFTSFGLFSPHNATVLVALLICALSVAGAVFLIVDMDQPYEGLLQVSSAPLRSALAQLGQ